jgi:hypothetical protein
VHDSTPTRLPGGSRLCTSGICMSEELATGTFDVRGELLLEDREKTARSS